MNVSAPNNAAQKKHVKNSLAELFFLNNHKGFFRAYVVYRSTFFAFVDFSHLLSIVIHYLKDILGGTSR